jgi:hypothetical protein
MHTLVTILLVFGFCVVLPLGLVSVFYHLMQRIAQHAPLSRDQGPVIHDPSVEQSSR